MLMKALCKTLKSATLQCELMILDFHATCQGVIIGQYILENYKRIRFLVYLE